MNWADRASCEAFLAPLLELDRVAVVRALADWGERVLPACDHDPRARSAIDAARAWAGAPGDEQRLAAQRATDVIDAALEEAPPRVMHALVAAQVAALLAAGEAQPRQLSLAATNAVTAIGWPTAPLPDYLGNPDQERAWQQERLARHLLSGHDS